MKQPEKYGTRLDLVMHRIATAEEDIEAAKILFDACQYRSANNRAYYGIFHSVSAIHALSGNAYKRHKDALANFNKEYVKTEIFPRTLGRRIAEAEEIRHNSDYDDFYLASKEETIDVIETAEDLLKLVKKYVKEQKKEKDQIIIP